MVLAETSLKPYHIDRIGEVTAVSRQCFDRQHPSLGKIKRTCGKGVAEAWLVTILADINEFCGVKTKLTTKQMADLAQMITTEYSYLTAAEIMLFAQRMKGGRYGQFYGTIDPQVILIALRDRFLPERYNALTAIEEEEKAKEREQWAKEAVSREEYQRLKQSGELKDYISEELWEKVQKNSRK